MKGSILDYSVQHNAGVISGDDQNRYQFTGSSWRGQNQPIRGQKVDFIVDEMGQANEIYVLNTPFAFPTQVGEKTELSRQFWLFS